MNYLLMNNNLNLLHVNPTNFLVPVEPTIQPSLKDRLKEKVHQIGLGVLSFLREVGAIFIAAGETIAFWAGKAISWVGKKLGVTQEAQTQKAQDVSLPIILLVHGYLHNESGWRSFKKAFAKEELPLGDVHVITKEKTFTSINLYSEQIHKKIEEIQAQGATRRKVILIGHSMGGLAITNYVNKHARPGEVAGVITLGSPLHGTNLAKKIGIGACAREMESDSAFLKDLLENADKHSSVKFYHLGFSHDELVPTQNSLRKESANATNEVAVGFGHVAPLYNKNVQKRVISWIKECL